MKKNIRIHKMLKKSQKRIQWIIIWNFTKNNNTGGKPDNAIKIK